MKSDMKIFDSMKKTILIIVSALVAFSVTSVASDMSSAVPQVAKTSRKKAEIKEVTFDVHLHCAGCVKKLRENIAFEKGVKDLHICMEDQIVYIKYDASRTNEEILKNSIIKLGVPVKGVSQGNHRHKH